MRRAILLLSTLTLAGARLAFGSPDEEELPAEPLLPPVTVRLASLGTPSRVVIRASGVRVVNPATGETTDAGDAVTVAAAGRELVLGTQRAASFRLEADRLTVEVGKLKRVYPEALTLTAAGGIRLENRCSLESYTAGVLCGECPALFHPEAIKAMAVAARSYSYRKAFLGKNDLCDTTHCQVYRGVGSVPATIRDAVETTTGLCGLFEGEVIDAVYSSDCGGYTEANEAAWKGARPVPYLRPVEDAPEPNGEAYCSVNRSHRWRLPLPRTRLQSLFGKADPSLRLEVVGTTESGRVRQLQLARVPQGDDTADELVAKGASRVYSGDQWRKLFGLSTVKSLRFEVKETVVGVELEGRGWGHGVGLCQYGANGMGRQGATFDRILTHYYSGIEVAPAPTVDEARARVAQKRVAEAQTGKVKGMASAATTAQP